MPAEIFERAPCRGKIYRRLINTESLRKRPQNAGIEDESFGRVRINGSPVNRRAPHGGFKLSGIGREWGRFGVEEFLEYQSVG